MRRIKKKNNEINIKGFIGLESMIGASGSKRVISTSKIKKIIAIRKNRKEKGKRADPLGSNPHSKGEFFSRSLIVFFLKIDDRVITK